LFAAQPLFSGDDADVDIDARMPLRAAPLMMI